MNVWELFYQTKKCFPGQITRIIVKLISFLIYSGSKIVIYSFKPYFILLVLTLSRVIQEIANNCWSVQIFL